MKSINKKYLSKIEEYEREDLKKVYKTILKGEIYAIIRSVSRSGMSRRISFYMIDKSEIRDITVFIYWLCSHFNIGEYKQGSKYLREEGMRVDGCGMDMIFHVLYTALDYSDAKDWNQKYKRL